MHLRLSAVKFIFTALLAMTMASGCATVKIHPEFNDRQAGIKRLAVLPPDVDAHEVTFNAGNKALPELKEIVKNNTASSLSSVLRSKGYDVADVKIEQSDIDNNPALKNAFFNIQTMYKKATEDIARNKQKQFTYDVGSSANYFADQHQVNALVLTRQVASRPSSGTTAAEVVSTTASIITTALVGVSAGGGISAPQTLVTEIAIIDADLGDILWYSLGSTTENFTKRENPKPIEKLVSQILSSFPAMKGYVAVPTKAVKPVPAMASSSPAKAPGNFTPRT